MLEHEFMRHAFAALLALAPVSGVVGYFLVVRNEVFAGDALSHVAFTGSLAALALGVSQSLGLFALCITAAVTIALLGRHARVGDTTIGVFFMWILGIGVLCLYEFTSNRSTSDSNAGPNVLFGSLFGISYSRAWQTVGLCTIALGIITVIARPLLFASFDNLVARTRGVPVKTLNVVFMVLVGVVVAEAVQVVGALLLLGLVATPAATVQRVVARPSRALAYSALLCLGEAYAGTTLAYYATDLPPSFAIIAISTIVYALTAIVTRAHKIKPVRV